MSDGGGNYSFYNHNLRRPTLQPNRLLTRQSSSENELNNFGRLSILSPTVKTDEPQFAGEPLVSSYVPHPPSSPRSKRATPIRFRAKKRSRHESPRTSGSEDEKFSRKQLAVSSSLQPIRSSSTGSLDGFSSDPEFHRRRHFRGLEPLNMTSRKDLVETFKIHQHGSKNQSLAHPMKVKRDINGNGDDRTVKNHENAIDNDKNTINNVKNEKLDKISHATNINSEQNCNIGENVKTENDLKESNNSIDNNECTTSKTTTESERTISLSDDDSFTNVSQSDDDNTLSSSSDSDDELKKKSEEIAEALTSRRYLDATLPSIPKGSNHSNNTTHYESMDANKPAELSNTYESVSGFEKVLNETNKDSETYLSDADFRRGDSEFSYGSQVSLLPRVPARTVKLRSTNFLEEEMEKYFPDKKVSVFVATWNMHEEKCIPGYLDEFLMPENVDFLPDMYVIGLQESTPLRKEWEIKLQETLGPSHVLMYSTTFGVLHMAVYIRRELVWFCSAVNQNSVATRPGHMIKTKGGLAVSFSLFGTSFLFINSHLTSDEGKFKDRVNDYNIIRKSLTLQTVEKPWTDNRPDVTDRFDRVFWLGDFNFRVNLKREKVDELLTQYKEQNTQDLKEMRNSDQLTNLMEKGEVFCGFTEPDVTFLPTYKYDLNSDVYDTSSKARVPSWTDRILFKSTEESSITSTCYDACSTVTISDHRPVYGIYEVTLKPCKKSVPLTGGQFVRDVYIEANRRRNTVNNRNQQDSSVCTIL